MDEAKLFQNGRSQAVRLPKEYRFEGNEVYIRRFGDMVLLISKDSGWKVMESSLKYFSDDFLEERKQPGTQDRYDVE